MCRENAHKAGENITFGIICYMVIVDPFSFCTNLQVICKPHIPSIGACIFKPTKNFDPMDKSGYHELLSFSSIWIEHKVYTMPPPLLALHHELEIFLGIRTYGH